MLFYAIAHIDAYFVPTNTNLACILATCRWPVDLRTGLSISVCVGCGLVGTESIGISGAWVCVTFLNSFAIDRVFLFFPHLNEVLLEELNLILVVFPDEIHFPLFVSPSFLLSALVDIETTYLL